MIFLSVKGTIYDEATKWWMEMWDGPEQVFSHETLLQVLRENPGEKEITLNIDCDGGSVDEGFKIYDTLRESGLTIYTNISGSCHSMATVLLLAAPFENRSASQNVRSLIHRVRAESYGIYTSDEAYSLAAMLEMEEETVLDVYADRTSIDREELRKVMKDEKIHNANSLLNLGFISKINTYNTNQFFNSFKKMGKSKTTNLSATEALRARMEAYRAKHNPALTVATPVNYDYKNGDGDVVFTTESETDDLAVGSEVTISSGDTSGTFILDDNREVVIEDNVVTEINEEDTQSLEERVQELESLVLDATNLVNTLTAENSALQERVNNLEDSTTGSTHRPSNANHRSQTQPLPTKNGDGESARALQSSDLKAEAKEKRLNFRNKTRVQK